MGAKEGTNQIELAERTVHRGAVLPWENILVTLRDATRGGSCKRESRLRVRLHGLHEVPQRLSACAAVP